MQFLKSYTISVILKYLWLPGESTGTFLQMQATCASNIPQIKHTGNKKNLKKQKKSPSVDSSNSNIQHTA